jgi:putative heme transporter
MAAVLAICVVLVVAAPLVIGTSWAAVTHTLRSVPAAWWPGLAVVWLLGLSAHATVLKASLPGLSIRRGLSLNLAGSAVGNSLPLGGALSIGLTTAMTRSWGFAPATVTSFLTLTSIWNTLSRLLFGGLAGAWLLTLGPGVAIGPPAFVIAAAVVGAVLVLGALLTNDRVLTGIGRAVTRVESAIRTRFQAAGRRRPENEMAGILVALRLQLASTLKTSWPRLVAGMAGYFILLAVLLDLCLHGLGTAPTIWLVVATVGMERLVTALPITPGGAGAAELTLVACLTAGGVSGVDALAAALLYRFFTFFAEIPVGAAVALGWHLARNRRRVAGLGAPEIGPAR